MGRKSKFCSNTFFFLENIYFSYELMDWITEQESEEMNEQIRKRRVIKRAISTSVFLSPSPFAIRLTFDVNGIEATILLLS